MVQPEAGMNALEQDPASLLLAIDDEDALRPRLAGRQRGAQPGRPAPGPPPARVRNLIPSRVFAPRPIASRISPSVMNSQRQLIRR